MAKKNEGYQQLHVTGFNVRKYFTLAARRHVAGLDTQPATWQSTYRRCAEIGFEALARELERAPKKRAKKGPL